MFLRNIKIKNEILNLTILLCVFHCISTSRNLFRIVRVTVDKHHVHAPERGSVRGERLRADTGDHIREDTKLYREPDGNRFLHAISGEERAASVVLYFFRKRRKSSACLPLGCLPSAYRFVRLARGRS